MLEGVAAGEDRGVGGAGLRDLRHGLFDEHAFAGQAIQGGRLRRRVAVRAHAVRAQGVDRHQEDVRRRRADAEGKEQAEHRPIIARRPRAKKTAPGCPGAVDAKPKRKARS